MVEEKNGKIVDLCVLPPCLDNLNFHITRANYVAYIYRHASQLKIQLDDCIDHGWTVDAQIIWTTNTVPMDFTDIILSVNENEDDQENEFDHDDEDDYDINLDDFS